MTQEQITLEVSVLPNHYVVWRNTDLTEGRGSRYPFAVCRLEATAERLAHKNDVQGTNCKITEEPVYGVAGGLRGTILGPITINHGTKEDALKEEEKQKQRKQKEKRDAVIAKAERLGLTQDDIEILKENY